MEWDYTSEIRLDPTMVFGQGYDFFGIEFLRQEAKGRNGNYLLWPAMDAWSLYRDSDGMFKQDFNSEDEAKRAALDWDKQDTK